MSDREQEGRELLQALEPYVEKGLDLARVKTLLLGCLEEQYSALDIRPACGGLAIQATVNILEWELVHLHSPADLRVLMEKRIGDLRDRLTEQLEDYFRRRFQREE